MNQKIFLIFGLSIILTTIPIVDAQTNFGVKANQESIHVILDKSETIHVEHIISPSNMPSNVKLFEGTISNLIVTNEKKVEVDSGVANDGRGNESIVIFPSNQKIIINYDLNDSLKLNNNMWMLEVSYDETYSILFPEEVNLVYLNNNLIKLEDKKGIAVNMGGNAQIKYFSELPKMINEIKWEDKEFDVEINSNLKIDEFNFEQSSKSISFEINEANEMITVQFSKELLWGPYVVLVNDEKIRYSILEDLDNVVALSFIPKSSGQITIIGTTVIPEFSMFIPLIMGFMIILTVPLMRKFSLR
jgi:hypothetical protein